MGGERWEGSYNFFYQLSDKFILREKNCVSHNFDVVAHMR
jgi:hypothetical protein